MSITLRVNRLAFRLWRSSPRLSAAGRAGPRRLAALIVGFVAGATVLAFIFLRGVYVLPSSHDARLPAVDALPGGLHSTPEQNALACRADTAHAQAALGDGRSFTPPMSPSVPYVPPPPHVEQAASSPATHPEAARPAAAVRRPRTASPVADRAGRGVRACGACACGGASGCGRWPCGAGGTAGIQRIAC